MRSKVYVLAFLGTMVFLMRFYFIGINILPIVMDLFDVPHGYSMVYMILTEVFRSLSACTRGHNFFGGCNLLLQIWAMEHFYRRPLQMDYTVDARNRIQSHEVRLRYLDAPIGKEE